MDERGSSNWEQGARKGPRPLVLFALFLVLTVGGFAGLFVWLFNSPAMRVQDQVYDNAPDIVTRTHYSTVNGFETLTIFVARDVTRAEAIDLQCRIVVPILLREGMSPLIVIVHPDNDFRLEGAACSP